MMTCQPGTVIPLLLLAMPFAGGKRFALVGFIVTTLWDRSGRNGRAGARVPAFELPGSPSSL